MPKCPNCYYELVLLEHRAKYKCAKCGELFPQLEIDSKEFREQNKKERQESRKQWHRESSQNQHARKVIPKIIDELNNPKPKKTKERYYDEHRDTIIQQKKSYRLSLSDQQKKEQNEKRKVRRYKNIDATRLKGRINYWKQQQKALAVQFFENEPYTAYNTQSQGFLATYSLSYLLWLGKAF